jgi:hypothetical protein
MVEKNSYFYLSICMALAISLTLEAKESKARVGGGCEKNISRGPQALVEQRLCQQQIIEPTFTRSFGQWCCRMGDVEQRVGQGRNFIMSHVTTNCKLGTCMKLHAADKWS